MTRLVNDILIWNLWGWQKLGLQGIGWSNGSLENTGLRDDATSHAWWIDTRG